MKLNQPFHRRTPVNNEERVAFNTPEPVKAEVSESEIPPLVSNKLEVQAIPKLERAVSTKKQVELKVPGEKPVEAVGSEIPPLVPQKSVEEVLAIPKLVASKREPVKLDPVDIPKMEAYNTMEVVHLLIGRSPEDEEIVLLQSFSERFVRTKKVEEFHGALHNRVNQHYLTMRNASKYDFNERQDHHTLSPRPVSFLHASKGVEWMAAVLDNGQGHTEDIQNYAASQGISYEEAIEEMKEAGILNVDPSYVFTWALVKVKIGHDFGSYKLSELMPSL